MTRGALNKSEAGCPFYILNERDSLARKVIAGFIETHFDGIMHTNQVISNFIQILHDTSLIIYWF